jgi:hypothetical protein
MRRITGALAQRIIFLAEGKNETPEKIGQLLGLPVGAVVRILQNRANSTVRVLENAHGFRRKNQNVPSFSGKQCVKSI